MKIEHRCKCGECVWLVGLARPQWSDGEYFLQLSGYCPICGCFLDDKGFAYEMCGLANLAELEDKLATCVATLKGLCITEGWTSKEKEYYLGTDVCTILSEDPADEGSDDDGTCLSDSPTTN